MFSHAFPLSSLLKVLEVSTYKGIIFGKMQLISSESTLLDPQSNHLHGHNESEGVAVVCREPSLVWLAIKMLYKSQGSFKFSLFMGDLTNIQYCTC